MLYRSGFTVLCLLDFLQRHNDIEDLVLHVTVADGLLNVGLYLILIA